MNRDPWRHRIPTRRELFLVFLACVFPTHLWTYTVALYHTPSLTLNLNLGEILAVWSYVQAVALVESMVLCAVVAGFVILLPWQRVDGVRVAWAASAATVGSVWAIVVNIKSEFGITGWELLALLGLLLGLYLLFPRFQRLTRAVSWLVGKLMVPSLTYLVLDSVGILVLIFQ